MKTTSIFSIYSFKAIPIKVPARFFFNVSDYIYRDEAFADIYMEQLFFNNWGI